MHMQIVLDFIHIIQLHNNEQYVCKKLHVTIACCNDVSYKHVVYKQMYPIHKLQESEVTQHHLIFICIGVDMLMWSKRWC